MLCCVLACVLVSVAITAATQGRDKLAAETQRLTKDKSELEPLLPDLRANAEQTRAELKNLQDDTAGLARDKTAALDALQHSAKQRQEAEAATEALRAESTTLERQIAEKRAALDAEVKTKLAEVSGAETRLKGLQEQIATAEARTRELDGVTEKLAAATQSLKDTESTRLVEEKTLATLSKNQEKLRADLAALESELKTADSRLAETTKAAKAAEARAADAEKRAEKAMAAQQAADTARAESEAAVEKNRADEKALRKQIPLLNTELAGIQAALATLNKERDEASQFVTRLNVTTENQNKKLTELHDQLVQLEDGARQRQERVLKIQSEVDAEAQRLKSAQERTQAAETALSQLDKDIKDERLKAAAAKKETAAAEEELRTRLDRVQNLKLDEDRLSKSVDNLKQDLSGADGMLKDLQGKIGDHQTRLSDYIHSGGKILSLAAAVSQLESRQSEVSKAIRTASEEDLAIQVKLNAAQEALNRETVRADQARKDREAAEAEFRQFSTEIQKQAGVLQNYEMEQKKRIAELEKRINDHSAMEQRLVTQVEQTKTALAALEGQRAEMAQAEAQLKHWQEIETRLRGQLGELEEKHEIMRRGLPLEEATVVMFATDIIKRIDLIDALTERYLGVSGGSDVAAQLRTLRQSFEDILLQHGVSEFEVAAGTEVDVALRKRIAVVDSLPGKAKPRVIETLRTGFIYSREEGHEVILRKVEVRTSSQ